MRTRAAETAGPVPSFVVGLGASAGGLDALEQFFANVPTDSGMAFVVVTHLAPDHKTLMCELLQRITTMPVREIADGARLAPDAVYVIPADRALALEGDVLRLRALSPRRGPRSMIDGFFRSLAAGRGTTAIAIVLSGTGADGAQGLAAIDDAGGITLVQDPDTAAFDAMPRAALAATTADAIDSPDRLPARIAALVDVRASGDAPAPAIADTGPSLARILQLLHRQTGHDLRLYKPATIERRMERRRLVHGLSTLAAYADHLDQNPTEAELLLRELMIGVTHFFRDAETFAALRDVHLPALLATRPRPSTLRAWVAGCSSGEEVYSLAIVIHEALAATGAHDLEVQLYGTDLDAAAVATARAGRYGDDIAEHVSAERLAAYFTREEGGYRIRPALRRTVVFARHDLISDPPFTRVDLLSCRNVLIYMQPALQDQLLRRFHGALAPGGLLLLGASESVSSVAERFTPADADSKVFRRVDLTHDASPPAEPAGAPTQHAARAGLPGPGSEPSMVDAARRAIVDDLAPPIVVINDRGDVLYVSQPTGRYLQPAIGKTNINIFAMAREGLGPYLVLAVRQALARRRRVTHAGVVVRGDRGRHHVDLTVLPMSEPAALRGLLLVRFTESAPRVETKGRAAGAGGKGKVAERELARVRAHLQILVREMEASRAQIETTASELQSANEDLQSTNEELSTSREELQSLNEELQTVNEELRAKNDALGTANDDLRNVLNSTRIPTLFLDNALRVKPFTSEVTRIANLIPGDVGRPITDITLKVDYPGLARDAAEVIETLVPRDAQVAGPGGTSYTVRIHPYRRTDNLVDGVVLTFSDVTALRRAEQLLAR